MSYDVGEATEGLENILWRKWLDGRCWSRTLCSFSNPSIASLMSQLILLITQPFRRFIYVIGHYPTLPSLHLRHSSFSNPSVASHTSHGLHLHHLVSRPWARPPPPPRANSRYATADPVSTSVCCELDDFIFEDNWMAKRNSGLTLLLDSWDFVL